MDNLYTYLNRTYLALEEVVGKEAIQSKTQRLLQVVLSKDKWNKKMHKFGYSNWMEDKLNEALYNTGLVSKANLLG